MNPLVTLAKFILENAHRFQWSLQGLGMFRLYLPNNARLHLWDTRFAFPGASPIHDHTQWGLSSTIIAGEMVNTRYAVLPATSKRGLPYWMGTFKAGYGAFLRKDPEEVRLVPQQPEIYLPGAVYEQRPEEVHWSQPKDGTVTIMHKTPSNDGETARIFWPKGEQWGSAEPRAASLQEVEEATRASLKRWFS